MILKDELKFFVAIMTSIFGNIIAAMSILNPNLFLYSILPYWWFPLVALIVGAVGTYWFGVLATREIKRYSK